jgi:hypothetical protein
MHAVFLCFLQVLKRSGTEQEKKHARRIEPVRTALQAASL